MLEEKSDAALWASLRRVLQEKETVLRRLAQAQDAVMPDIARNALREADMIANLGKAIRRLTKSAPSPGVLD